MNVEQHGGGFVIFRDDSASGENANSAAMAGDSEFIDHIRSREFAERAAAKHATCDRARQVHQELAQAYARMLRRAGLQ